MLRTQALMSHRLLYNPVLPMKQQAHDDHTPCIRIWGSGFALRLSAADVRARLASREAGVRNLKKLLEKIYRKAALKLVKRGVEGPPKAEAEPSVQGAPIHLSSPCGSAFHVVALADATMCSHVPMDGSTLITFLSPILIHEVLVVGCLCTPSQAPRQVLRHHAIGVDVWVLMPASRVRTQRWSSSSRMSMMRPSAPRRGPLQRSSLSNCSPASLPRTC